MDVPEGDIIKTGGCQRIEGQREMIRIAAVEHQDVMHPVIGRGDGRRERRRMLGLVVAETVHDGVQRRKGDAGQRLRIQKMHMIAERHGEHGAAGIQMIVVACGQDDLRVGNA